MNENEIAAIVVKAVFEMHNTLGPGLLESVYEQILARKLKKEGLQVEVQKKISMRVTPLCHSIVISSMVMITLV